MPFIKLEARKSSFLDKSTAGRGEIFYDEDNKSLRIFDGQNRSGQILLSSFNLKDRLAEENVATVTYRVTVTAPHGSDVGNKYNLNNIYWPDLNFVIGYTYVFNQDDPTNVYYPNSVGQAANPHPLNFSSDDANGEKGSGTTYTDNVVYKLNGETVTKERYNSQFFNNATSREIRITITPDTPETMYYYCWNHLNMGATITAAEPGTGSGASVAVGDTVPETANEGSLWFDTNTASLLVYFTDGDTEQWVQPTIPYPDLSVFSTKSEAATLYATKASLSTVATTGAYSDLTGKPVIAQEIYDLGIEDGTANQVLTTDGDGVVSFSSTIESIVFNGSTLNSEDSSAITFVPVVNFDSDVTISNELTVRSINSIGDTTLLGINLTSEKVSEMLYATGTVPHDLSLASIFNHNYINSDFTVNFTNVPITNGRSISVALILNQSGTAYLSTSAEIDGSSVPIYWQNGVEPLANINSQDIVSFTLIRSNDQWTIFGSLSNFAP
jgi:hypothetical protein